MKKRPERGENEITVIAKREAARTKEDVCTILAEMLEAAKAGRDQDLVRKIIQAQKFLGCRNTRKRSSQ